MMTVHGIGSTSNLLLLLACGCSKDTPSDTACVERQGWLDEDGDGFGSEPVAGCDLPPGAVELDGDCDDGDATIHPTADEVPYDGLDQDCDGEDLDDVDGDGFDVDEDCDDTDPDSYPGAEEVPHDGVDQDCDGEDLLDADGDGSDVDEDCDDTDPTRSPDLTETCGDGVDNDCNGIEEDCLAFEGLPGITLGAVVWGTKTEAGVVGGGAVAGEPTIQFVDANGDSRMDLVLPADDRDDWGSLHLVYGPLTGHMDTRTALHQDLGTTSSDDLGLASGSPCGGSELVVTVADQTSNGLVTLLGDELTVEARASATAESPSADGLGYSALLMSLHGASCDALLLGAPLSRESTSVDHSGSVFIIELTTTATDLSLPEDADHAILGQEPGGFGASLGIVDRNGDGESELLVGGSDDAALAYFGVPSTISAISDADALMPPPSSGWFSYLEFSASDLSGDGLEDVVATIHDDSGSPNEAWVHYELFHGTVVNDADVTLVGASGYRDIVAAAAGDLNGDDEQDLMIGEWAADDRRGLAWILLGPISAGTYTVAEADGHLYGQEPTTECDAGPNCWNYGSYFGQTVLGSGDLNADGYDDVAITAPHHSLDPELHGPGGVYLFFGGE